MSGGAAIVPASTVVEVDAHRWYHQLPIWAYAGVLAWAPFPLGSNRPWSWNVLICLIMLCWVLWGIANWARPQDNWIILRRHPVAFGLALCSIFWIIVQTIPMVPPGWAHPAWNLAASTLHVAIPSAISLNPWRTLSEGLKLCSYAMALWLSYLMGRRTEAAGLLLNTIIAIGATYGIYSGVLQLMGATQFELFYSGTPVHDPYFTGPFVLHNSYATFAGLIAVAAIARLIAKGQSEVVTVRGLKQFCLSVVQFLFGRGLGYLLAFLIAFSTLIASASRAGTFATVCGLLFMLVLTSIAGSTTTVGRWSFGSISALCLLTVGLLVLTGDSLVSQLNDLVDVGRVDGVRLALWAAALRMISDAPLLGLGLGTFADAYPLYASQVLPFVMDKAHNDYLEFAAGLGLPAAIAWWGGWLIPDFRVFRWNLPTSPKSPFCNDRSGRYCFGGCTLGI